MRLGGSIHRESVYYVGAEGAYPALTTYLVSSTNDAIEMPDFGSNPAEAFGLRIRGAYAASDFDRQSRLIQGRDFDRQSAAQLAPDFDGQSSAKASPGLTVKHRHLVRRL
jgi:hypothetical protein